MWTYNQVKSFIERKLKETANRVKIVAGRIWRLPQDISIIQTGNKTSEWFSERKKKKTTETNETNKLTNRKTEQTSKVKPLEK